MGARKHKVGRSDDECVGGEKKRRGGEQTEVLHEEEEGERGNGRSKKLAFLKVSDARMLNPLSCEVRAEEEVRR